MNLKNDMISVVNSRTNSEAGRFLPTLLDKAERYAEKLSRINYPDVYVVMKTECVPVPEKKIKIPVLMKKGAQTYLMTLEVARRYPGFTNAKPFRYKEWNNTATFEATNNSVSNYGKRTVSLKKALTFIFSVKDGWCRLISK